MLDSVQRHEAGHAVVAAIFGTAFDHVSASDRDGWVGGHVRFDGQVSVADPADWLLVTLAGMGAEKAAGFDIGTAAHDADIGQALAALEALGSPDPLAALPGITTAVGEVFKLPVLRGLVDAVANDLARNDGWLPAAAVRGHVWAVPDREISPIRRRLRRIVSGRLSNL